MQNIGKNAKVTVRWDVLPVNYTREDEKNIIAKMAKKYGIDEKQIRVEPNFIGNDPIKKQSIAAETTMNVRDPKFHLSLYKEFMERNNITDVPFEEIEKLDSQINTMIDYDSYEQSRHYSIKWVRFSNFLSYGDDNYVDFTKFKGLILLNGEPANKSGKSTFANDLIRFLLFGKTKSGKAARNDQYFNNYRPDCNEVSVEGCITINGEDYIIRRKLTRPKGKLGPVKNSVHYSKVMLNGTEEELADVDNLQGETTTKTNKIIKDTIGNEEDFDLIVSACMKDLDELISLKDTERGRIMSRWTGLSVFEDKEAIAREKWNREISQGRYCDIYNRETLKTEIDTMIEENDRFSEEIITLTNKIEESEKKIEGLKAKRDELLINKKPIDSELEKYDITTIEAEIQRTTEEGKKRAALLSSINEQIEKIGEVDIDEDRRNELIGQRDSLTDEIGQLKGTISVLKETIKKLKTAEYCPTCGKKMDDVDNSQKINEKEGEVQKLIEQGVLADGKRKKVIEELSQIEQKYNEFKKKSKLEVQKSAVSVEVDTLRNKLIEARKKRNLLSENAETIAENNRIDADIRVIDESIKVEEQIKSNTTEEIIIRKKDREANLKSINEKKAIIVTIENELKTEKLWKTYIILIGKDGVSKMVLNNLLPYINGEMSRLLSDIDFNVEVELNNKNDVDLWLIRDGIKTKLTAASGYERTMASLALRFVLGQMSNLSKPPFLLLDEVLGGVARENYDDVKKLYEKIVPSFDFVFHITHLSDIVDWHDGGIITVQKINDISSLKSNI